MISDLKLNLIVVTQSMMAVSHNSELLRFIITFLFLMMIYIVLVMVVVNIGKSEDNGTYWLL